MKNLFRKRNRNKIQIILKIKKIVKHIGSIFSPKKEPPILSDKDKQSMSRLNYFISDTKCNAIKVSLEPKEKTDVINALLSEQITPYDFDKIKRSITTVTNDESKKNK